MIKTQVLRIVSAFIWCSLLLSIIGYSSTIKIYAAEMTNTRVIVSMGDSYSAGEGIEPYYGSSITSLEEKVKNQDWLAHRSMNSWPGQLSLDSIGTMSDEGNKDNCWYFVATSGAVTYDIKNDKYQDYRKSVGTGPEGAIKGSGKIDAQINVFNTIKEKNQTVDYVTLTLGGNDAGFKDVITSALNPVDYLMPNNLYEQFSYLFEPDKEGHRGIDTILSNLEQSYKDISSEAGNQARIIVAGYPKLLDENGKGFLVRKDSAKVIDNAIHIFNEKIEQLVKKNETKYNTYFVSVESAFDGKAAYTKDAYINGISIPTTEDRDDWSVGGATFHPNAKGAKAYADCVQAKINKLEGRTSRTKPTEKPTDKHVDTPTHKPDEAKVPEYTAVKLASKSLDEIKSILGNDYTSEHIQLSNAFSSSGTPYIYNYDVLPGLAFATGNDDYYGISIMDGAYLNDKISSDMKYNQIADIIGDNDGFRAGQGNNIAFGVTIDGYEVTFCFIENDYIRNHNSDATVPSSVLRAGNPSLQSIGLRREPTVKPTEKPTDAPTPTKVNSDSSYSSYLGTWEYVNNASGIPDDPYAVVTSVTFNEINGSTANITIFKGNLAKVCQIDVTAEIIDGKIDFSYDKDGWENSGHGTITLNEDSIHLYAEVDSYGPNARMGLSCDDTLYRS